MNDRRPYRPPEDRPYRPPSPVPFKIWTTLSCGHRMWWKDFCKQSQAGTVRCPKCGFRWAGWQNIAKSEQRIKPRFEKFEPRRGRR